MQCPNGDGELDKKIHQKEGLVITYHQCPVCDGSWLDAFNTNYLKTEDLAAKDEALQGSPSTLQPICPQCSEPLAITHGENIPGDVQTWKCPNSHGYFFPKGELFKFKRAQEAKITYFKLWSIPFPKVASVLLAVFLFFIVSFGLITVQQRQNVELQAQRVIKSQQVFVADRAVTIAVTTTTKTSLTIHIGDVVRVLETQDQLLHTIFLSNLSPGIYEYYVTFDVSGTPVSSDTFRFVIR